MRIKDVLDAFESQPPDSISDVELERIYADAKAAGLATEEDINVGYSRLMELHVRWTSAGRLVLDAPVGYPVAEAHHRAGGSGSSGPLRLDDHSQLRAPDGERAR